LLKCLTTRWSKHRRESNAYGELVFFVQDNSCNPEYVPRYQEQRRDRLDDRRGEHRHPPGDSDALA
jgi:hypothetical protein